MAKRIPLRKEIERILDALLFSGDGSLNSPFEEIECVNQLAILIDGELSSISRDITARSGNKAGALFLAQTRNLRQALKK